MVVTCLLGMRISAGPVSKRNPALSVPRAEVYSHCKSSRALLGRPGSETRTYTSMAHTSMTHTSMTHTSMTHTRTNMTDTNMTDTSMTDTRMNPKA
jgi:uncharacterized protein involved in copper resistance